MIELDRFEDGRTMLFVGLRRQYTAATNHLIPEQWQTFLPFIEQVKNRIGEYTYGVIGGSDMAGNVDYLSGVEVTDFESAPSDLSRMKLSPQRYAVFIHPNSINTLKQSWMSILSEWIPASPYDVVETAEFERYSADFDAAAGTGRIEIWIPIEDKRSP